jgi:hypothetical protein
MIINLNEIYYKFQGWGNFLNKDILAKNIPIMCAVKIEQEINSPYFNNSSVLNCSLREIAAFIPVNQTAHFNHN